MDKAEWQIWFVRKDNSRTYLIQEKLKNVDSNLIQEVEHLIKVGKKRYLQDNVY